MSDKFLSTGPYKGVRDFYPADMAVQRYIFDSWSRSAESFGFERYDASILEPSDLYKTKGAVNEEMVNEQTYTFIDRGEREVTLRPEMTPTVARMVAGKRQELSFPLRWYSIPNVFRYERPQRGRLREHWQFNCDIFGSTDSVVDIEIIALAYQVMIDFGASPEMFEILLNDRAEMTAIYHSLGIVDETQITAITRLNDRKNKITASEYQSALLEIVGNQDLVDKVLAVVEDNSGTNPVLAGLRELGITNARIDRTIARGFDYYTGTVFELVDTHPDNNRAMLGGGRYDNLTGMFGGEPIVGIGFGMGDVTMRDFLEIHDLLPDGIKSTAPKLVLIPMNPEQNLVAEKIAMRCRSVGVSGTVDCGTKKLGKKISDASARGATFIIVVGENEIATNTYTVKNLVTTIETSGTLETLLPILIA